jgi:hypothetical protein
VTCCQSHTSCTIESSKSALYHCKNTQPCSSHLNPGSSNTLYSSNNKDMSSGPYDDGLYESDQTPYELMVFQPPSPSAPWKTKIPKIFTRKPTAYPNVGKLSPGNSNPNIDNFRFNDLLKAPQKTVKITSQSFHLHLRCDHVEKDRKCDKGCYVREKGGKEKCARKDCAGHVYMGKVKEHEGVKCFGVKGKRMVCLERPVFVMLATALHST